MRSNSRYRKALIFGAIFRIALALLVLYSIYQLDIYITTPKQTTIIEHEVQLGPAMKAIAEAWHEENRLKRNQ